MFDETERRIARGNKMLFSMDDPCLGNLADLILKHNRRTVVMWALECAEVTVKRIEVEHPEEKRPRNCLGLCTTWAKGEVKMQQAKRAILDCHSAAKSIEDPEFEALCHAVGQACSTSHVKGHARGLALYELTAIVIQNGKKEYEKAVIDKILFYERKMSECSIKSGKSDLKWAEFLIDDEK